MQGGDTVSWTRDGLTSVFSDAIARSKTGCLSFEVFEAGLPWTDGAKCYSTGLNGTHHVFVNEHDLAQCKSDAASFAGLVIEKTQDFPSWRSLTIEGGLNGIYSVSAHGGTTNTNAGAAR